MRYSITALELFVWVSLFCYFLCFVRRFLAFFQDVMSFNLTPLVAAEDIRGTRDDVAFAAPLVPVTRLPRMSERTAPPTCLTIVIFSHVIIVPPGHLPLL